MSNVTIRFSTNILRRLGEELNTSPDQGLIELIKNAYDANARECVVELTDIGFYGGTISIADDGDGMVAEDIRDGWLVLGRSKKTRDMPTRLGRTSVGDKGLGRLAAIRMGTSASLTTVPLSDPQAEYTLMVNWDLYDKAELVDDVSLEIIERKYPIPQSVGTKISINNLKTHFGRMDVKRLARAMILLADPFGDNPLGFKPLLKAPEFKDLEKLVENRYFNDAEFHLIAKVNSAGTADAAVIDWRGNELFHASHADLRPKSPHKPYECPEATFDLWAFILDEPTFLTRTSTKGEVQNWLKEFGGVHLYYNSLRVSPYGDDNDDWLGLNLMRSRSPELRPSTNTAIGRMSVTDIRNALVQKTDRSGFIENASFRELRQFAIDALNWMAKRRLEERERKRAAERTESSKKRVQESESIENVVLKVPRSARKSVKTALEKYNKTRDKEFNQLRKEVQLYRTLSTVGITAAVFAHESAHNPIKVIETSIKTVRRRGQNSLGDSYVESLKEPVDRIIQSVDALKVLGNVALSLVDHEKRRMSRVEIHQTVKEAIELFEPFLEERKAKISMQFDYGQPYLRGSVAAIESIITNLINNSLYAFEGNAPGERKIIVRTSVGEKYIDVRVLDNGPGIQGISKRDIWLPGQTTKANGTGLGLTIVRDAVIDLGGNVDAVEKGELGGAEIIISLPILGA